jgi:hypothetical protein
LKHLFVIFKQFASSIRVIYQLDWFICIHTLACLQSHLFAINCITILNLWKVKIELLSINVDGNWETRLNCVYCFVLIIIIVSIVVVGNHLGIDTLR